MCGGGDIFKVAALAAGAYFLGPAVFGETLAGESGALLASEGAISAGAVAGSEALASGVGAAGGDAIGSLIASNAANWGLEVAPEIAALGGTAAELAAISAAGEGAAAAAPAAAEASGTPAAAGGAAAGGTALTDGLKTAASLAPLATLAMAASAPKAPSGQASVLAPVTPPPESQAASTPAPNIFKKKMRSLGDPTMTSGTGGVTDLSLGKATILGR